MENWVHIEPMSGTGNSTISIILDANDSTESRTTTVDVATSTLNKQLLITQKGLEMDSIIFKMYSEGTLYFDEVLVNGTSITLDRTGTDATISKDDFYKLYSIIDKGLFICNYSYSSGGGIFNINLKQVEQSKEYGFTFTFADGQQMSLES